MNQSTNHVADDHALFAEGLKRLLEPEYEIVAIVHAGNDLVTAALKLHKRNDQCRDVAAERYGQHHRHSQESTRGESPSGQPLVVVRPRVRVVF